MILSFAKIVILLIKDTAPFLTHASAEVYLYEVEAELVEEEVTVLTVMTIETDTQAERVLVIIAATGVVTTVGVDSGLESETVDVVYNWFQAIGKRFLLISNCPVMLSRPPK